MTSKRKKETDDWQTTVYKTVKENSLSFFLGLISLLLVVFFMVRLDFIKIPQITFLKFHQFKKISSLKNQKITKNELKVHIVKSGETLWSIAEKYYGSGFNAADLAEKNQISNPDLIEEGQKIIIPSISPKIPTRGKVSQEQTKKVTSFQQRYTVEKGDYLWKIAEKVYGDGHLWIKIAQANNIKNPDIIPVGTQLFIPR